MLARSDMKVCTTKPQIQSFPLAQQLWACAPTLYPPAFVCFCMSPSSLVSVLAHVGKPGQTLAIPLPSAMSSAVIILSAKPTVMTTRLLPSSRACICPGSLAGWC